MLSVQKLSKAYGLQLIFENISFTINDGDRVGLIGPNGCGKSTLLRLLARKEQADSGAIIPTPPTLKVGYLTQGFVVDPAWKLQTFLHDLAGDPQLLQAQLTAVAQQIASRPDDESLQAEYDLTLQRLNRADYGRLPSLLAAFGLAHLDPQMPLSLLSGGQKTRLALVRILLDDPDLLLLDEPTNHLDIEMLEWLENWLMKYAGAALIVSHDRTFLDKTVQRILDLDQKSKSLREYAGNYTDYLDQFLLEKEKQMAAWRDQVAEIRRMRQDIARTREQSMQVERSTTPRNPNVRRLAKKVMRKALSREKKLERYLQADERVEKPGRSWQMKLDLAETAHLGKDVLILENLSIGFDGERPLLQAITAQLLAGQRVILTGANGTGKTTLLRTIAGYLPPLAGSVHRGASVVLGYMSQEQEGLDPQSTAVETIQSAASFNHTEARSYLHYFLFSGDESLKPIDTLSYGQRARLALARLVASGCNLLLLDEPINHLDIPSRTQFEAALAQFAGTILAVVHDRYFIERFATDIWLVEEGKIVRLTG